MNHFRFNICLFLIISMIFSQCSNTVDSTFSEDLKILYVSDLDGDYDIYFKNLSTNVTKNITINSDFDARPALSLDETKVAFYTRFNHQGFLAYLPLNGQAELLTQISTGHLPAISYNGDFIIYESSAKNTYDLFKFIIDTKEIINLTQGKRYSWNPSISPDDTKMVYDGYYGDSTNITREIFLCDFVLNTHKRISPNSGKYPQFSPSGKNIIYSNGNSIFNYNIEDSSTATVLTNLVFGREVKYSYDGKNIFYIAGYPEQEIFLYNFENKNIKCLTSEADYYAELSVSRNGKWIAYRKGISEFAEIYIMDTDGNQTHRITNNLVDDGSPIILSNF